MSEATRSCFVTEGILLRQMSFDATLCGVSPIVIDGFHERHLYGDIPRARALQIQRTRLAAQTTGDLLVFMPGALEIGRTVQEIQGSHALRGFACFPLHGELPPEAQDRAVARYDTRKIIVSTNVWPRRRSPSTTSTRFRNWRSPSQQCGLVVRRRRGCQAEAAGGVIDYGRRVRLGLEAEEDDDPLNSREIRRAQMAWA